MILREFAKQGTVIREKPSNYAASISGVLLITLVGSGKVFVSVTGDIFRVWNRNITSLQSGKHEVKEMQHDYYQGCDGVEICFIKAERKEALRIKQIILDKFIGTGMLYNKSSDAAVPAKGWVRTTETRKKHREKQLGKMIPPMVRKKMSASHTGKKMSEETKKKKSLIMKEVNKDVWLRNRAKKVVIDGKLYPSTREAARLLGMNPGCISHRLRSDLHPTFQYHTEETKEK